MPGLEVVTRSFAEQIRVDGQTRMRCLDMPYIPIHQCGYGRMDGTTPASGLATSNVADCVCFVFHCNETGRTVVTHSLIVQCHPGSLGLVMAWVTGGKTPIPVVEVVVLRGFFYSVLESKDYVTICERHVRWMKHIREYLTSGPSQVNVTEEKQLLMAGSVMVDKGTGKITIIDGGVVVHSGWQSSLVDLVQITNSTLANNYYRPSFVDAFVVCASFMSTPVLQNLHLQYNVNEYELPMALSPYARAILRSKYIGDSEQKQIQILQSMGVESWYVNNMTRDCQTFCDRVIANGMACELCPLMGKACGQCKGAWYCGKDHQKEDWKSHKAWCKLVSKKFTNVTGK